MKQETNGWIIAKFTTEQKDSLDTFLTSFSQAYDFIFSVLIFQFKGVWNCLFFKRVSCNIARGGGGFSTKFYTGTLRFEVQPLNFLFPCYPRQWRRSIEKHDSAFEKVSQKVPLSYTFYGIANGTPPSLTYLA